MAKSKESKEDKQKSYYFINKTAIQKRRNTGSPKNNNLSMIQSAQEIQQRNSEVFKNSYFGTEYYNYKF